MEIKTSKKNSDFLAKNIGTETFMQTYKYKDRNKSSIRENSR